LADVLRAGLPAVLTPCGCCAGWRGGIIGEINGEISWFLYGLGSRCEALAGAGSEPRCGNPGHRAAENNRQQHQERQPPSGNALAIGADHGLDHMN